MLRDKTDYIKKITDDKIINVTVSVGSGKSTYSIKYRDNPEYIVIGLDSIKNDNDYMTLNKDILNLRKYLLKIYKDLTQKDIFYYNDIVKFIKNNGKKGIIEGGNLTEMNITDFVGTVVVKRTARLKCYLWSAWRDYKNPAWRKGLSKFGLIKRFLHCYKRRFHHIFTQKHIEEFIEKLENYKNI